MHICTQIHAMYMYVPYFDREEEQYCCDYMGSRDIIIITMLHLGDTDLFFGT